MDEQIARTMFDTIADEVVKYTKNPDSNALLLINNLRGRVNFPDRILINDAPQHKNVEAEVSFYLDDSKKQKINVYVRCSKDHGAVIGYGNVSADQALYDCRPHLYE
jgi:hypothetical protein